MRVALFGALIWRPKLRLCRFIFRSPARSFSYRYMRTDIATDWNHLQDLLFEDSWNKGIGRFRSPWAFRGLSDADYPLQTTLMRLGGAFGTLERHLLRNFIKYAHRDVVQVDSLWHWLSVAQHHGLPTRLLDWTYSPLVAMHFLTANSEKMGIDGAIWCVNYEETGKLLPGRLRKELIAEGAHTLTTELLTKAAPRLEEFDAMASDPFLVFFEPPSMDDRIVNQFALFSVMSSTTVGLDAWFPAHPETCRKVIVPPEIKREVRDKLDQCNVTERVLFPGLDGLSSWLRRHYAPRDDS